MRALSVYCINGNFDYEKIKTFYCDYRPSNSISIENEIDAFENLILALHNLQAIKAFNKSESQIEIVRSAIIAWYYLIFYASKAMVCAGCGGNSQTHSQAAKMWHANHVLPGDVIAPFSFYISNLTTQNIDNQIKILRDGNTYTLNDSATNIEEAKGAIMSYLKGTAKFEQDKAIESIRKTKEFKALDVDNFRTKEARKLRDSDLEKKTVNFLNQAFRYRGKANYRDALYLTIKNSNASEINISAFLDDILIVGNAFIMMSMEYTRKKVRKNSWVEFIKDFNEVNSINFNYDSFLADGIGDHDWINEAIDF